METAKLYLQAHPECKGLYFNDEDSWHFVNHGTHADATFKSREDILGDVLVEKPKSKKK